MPLTELNHYFIRAKNLERTRDYYMEVLGLEIMPRPDFPFPGFWLGTNGKILVHMGQAGIPNSDVYYLGSPEDAANDNAGVIDHVAFLATEPEKFIERFRKMGVAYRARSFPDAELYQIFIKDPDGVTIELNFNGIKGRPNWGGETYSEMPRAKETAK